MQNHLHLDDSFVKSLNLGQLIHYTGDVEAPYYFFALNNQFANVHTYYDSFDVELLFEESINYFQVTPENTWIHRYTQTEKSGITAFLVQIQKNLFLSFNSQDNAIKVYFGDSIPTEKHEEIAQLVHRCKRDELYARGKIFLMYEMSGYLYLRDFEVKKTEIDVELNYNDDFLKVHETIVKRLSSDDDKGLVLLHGSPGTGKTHYLRHLTSVLNKKMIFIPPDYASHIASPHFLPLMISNPNSILIIEDAETIVESREESGRSGAVSSLLNMADGLLSDCLNIQIICTFNTHISNIDKALLRKGRLIANYEFKALDANKAQKLSNKIGFKRWIEDNMTLAEIYNQDI